MKNKIKAEFLFSVAEEKGIAYAMILDFFHTMLINTNKPVELPSKVIQFMYPWWSNQSIILVLKSIVKDGMLTRTKTGKKHRGNAYMYSLTQKTIDLYNKETSPN